MINEKKRKQKTLALAVFVFVFVAFAAWFGFAPLNARAGGTTFAEVDTLHMQTRLQINEYESMYNLDREYNGSTVLGILETDYQKAITTAEETGGDYTSVVNDFLSGDNGFAGALKFYKKTNEWCKEIDAAASGDLYLNHSKKIAAEKNSFVYGLSLSDGYLNGTSEPYGFGYGYLNGRISESKKTVRGYQNETRDYDLEYLNPLLNKLKEYEVTRFSAKYDKADVENALFGESGTANLADKLSGIAAEVKQAGRTLEVADAADYKNAVRAAMEKVARAYEEKYESVKSVAAKAKDTANSFISGGKTVAELKDQLGVINEAIAKFYALPQVSYEALPEKGKAARTVTIDLKDGADKETVTGLIDSYKSFANDAVTAAYETNKGDYGLSGQVPVATNRRIAKELIDKLALVNDESGVKIRLPEESVYEYDGVSVCDAVSIIEAYEASYQKAGTLKSGETLSENISDYYYVASVSSKDEDGKAPYVITITCVTKDGDPVKKFDALSYISVREGATASVERNINKALKNPDKYCGDGVSAEEQTNIKNRSLWYYFTLTIYEPDVNGSPVVRTDLKTDETTVYVVKIEYKAETLKGKADTDENRKKVSIIFYEHTTVTGVISNIEWIGEGENTMQFRVDDVSRLLTFEAITGDAKWDWACWAVIGLVALFVLFLIVLIIVKCVKNKKYKIVFNARGGKFNTSVKVKYGASFAYPKDPVKKGFVFMGWYTDKKCANRFASTRLVKRGNVNVYAKWMKVEDYEKLNEQYSRAKAIVDPAVASADAQYFASLQKDPQIEKIEAEKLSYIAKKAEEDRKTEEVKLQSVKEIEMAKGNEEARIKAEKDAAEARKALDEAMAERDALIKQAKTEERAKCDNEAAASIRAENETLAQIIAGSGKTTVVADRDFDEELRKAKEEGKAEAKREYEEAARRKAEEEARINAIVEARVKELVDKYKGETEISKAGDDDELNARITEAEQRAAAAEEDARKAREEAKTYEEAAKIHREAAERAEQARKDAEAAFMSMPAVEEKPAEEPAETAKYFDRLKAETASYVKGDDLEFGTQKDVTVCALTEEDGKVVLELNVPYEDLEEKGYNVIKGDKLPSAYEVGSQEDIDEALELIEEAMSANGMMKSVPQVVYASTAAERAQGYEYVIHNEKVADDVNEYYALIRAYTGSFADVEGYEGEDKPLVKMFKDGNNVLVYMNYSAAGLKASEPYMAEQGYTSVVTVSDISDCKRVMAYIEQMMKENGLIRYPLMTGFVESGDDDGFAYVLRA